MKLIILVLLSVFINISQNSEILVVAPTPSYSHFSIAFTLAKELAQRGHQVTCINPYPQKVKIANYTDVPVTENIGIMAEEQERLFKSGSRGVLEQLTSVFDLIGVITDSTFNNKHVRKLLDSKKTFDLVIVEHFFNEAFVGFGEYVKAPVVLITAGTSGGMNNYIFANPTPASYVPGKGAALTKHMNFWERMQNLMMNSVFEALIHLYHLPKQRMILQTHISKDIELDDVLYNTSLMLTNSHVSVSEAVPLTPNIIEIGGFHINSKPLPEDLQTFLDEAENGAILFSLGSIIRSEALKPEVQRGILKVFSKLKQRVIWKFETGLSEVPENVKIQYWLPQQDILAHPNVRAFISHGGVLSMIEAVFFGIPVIGIPIFGDQLHNVAAAVEDGYAVRINLDDLSEETLFWALEEILTNPKYREIAQIRSRLIRDRPLKPIDSAVFWVEHVIRHKGAPHLRSAGLDLEWYQREMLDVFVFLFAVVCSMFLMTFVIFKKFFQCICPKKVTATKVKKTQ